MKKTLSLVLAVALSAVLTACGNSASPAGADLDLTGLSGTAAYSEVYNITNNPAKYRGKTLRLAGYTASNYYAPTDTTYYSVIIPDAGSCCSQGIEYLLAEGERYPIDGTDVVISGTFEAYEELGTEYCRLGNASILAYPSETNNQ